DPHRDVNEGLGGWYEVLRQ
ncbi:hypothetical protein LSM04_001984, partial [Trypanosoma melophagium]